MKLYGFTIDNELVTITDQLWERAMVSSGLRSDIFIFLLFKFIEND